MGVHSIQEPDTVGAMIMSHYVTHCVIPLKSKSGLFQLCTLALFPGSSQPFQSQLERSLVHYVTKKLPGNESNPSDCSTYCTGSDILLGGG